MPVPLYVSVTPAKGSFPHLATKKTVFNRKATEQVPKMNLIMFLQSILYLDTKMPLITWPSAAAGTNTSPPRVDLNEELKTIQFDYILKKAVQHHFCPG